MIFLSPFPPFTFMKVNRPFVRGSLPFNVHTVSGNWYAIPPPILYFLHIHMGEYTSGLLTRLFCIVAIVFFLRTGFLLLKKKRKNTYVVFTLRAVVGCRSFLFSLSLLFPPFFKSRSSLWAFDTRQLVCEACFKETVE